MPVISKLLTTCPFNWILLRFWTLSSFILSGISTFQFRHCPQWGPGDISLTNLWQLFYITFLITVSYCSKKCTPGGTFLTLSNHLMIYINVHNFDHTFMLWTFRFPNLSPWRGHISIYFDKFIIFISYMIIRPFELFFKLNTSPSTTHQFALEGHISNFSDTLVWYIIGQPFYHFFILWTSRFLPPIHGVRFSKFSR